MARKIYQRRTRNLTPRDTNRVGQAVGTIGTAIGDAYDTYEDEKEKTIQGHKDVDDQLETILAEVDENIYDPPTFGSEDDDKIVPVENIPYEDDFEDPEIPTYTTIGGGGSGSGNGGGSGGVVDIIDSNNGNPYPEIVIPQGAPGVAGGMSIGVDTAQRISGGIDKLSNLWDRGKSWFSGLDLTGGSDATTRGGGTHTNTPMNRRSPFDRHSPFHATQFDPNTGTPIGEGYQQRAVAPSYLGEIGAAGAEGYNRSVDRHNYKRMVWETKQKELDQQFGELQVPPSGVAPLDASVETMARQWKTELAQLQRAKGDLDPGEYAAKKHEIMGRSKTYKAASQQIQQLLTDYAKDKDNISASTKPEILDLIETLSQGGDIQISNNFEGQPTLSGKTLGGKGISVPLAQIANGKNAFRYNTKVDIAPQMNQISKGLAGLKRDVELKNGAVLRGPQAWGAVEQSASAQIDNLLNNEAAIRSIAAEQFNIDYDAYEQMGSETAKDTVKDLLMQRLENQYSAAESAQTIARQAPKVPVGQQRAQQQTQRLTRSLSSDQGVADLNNRISGRGLKIFKQGNKYVVWSNIDDKRKRSKEAGGSMQDVLAYLQQISIKY